MYVLCVAVYNILPTLMFTFLQFWKTSVLSYGQVSPAAAAFTFHEMASIFQRTYSLFYQSCWDCSPSKGRPTLKAMRFSVVDEKILSTHSHAADSNNEGGVVFSFCTRRAPLQGAFSKQTVDLKPCYYSLQCSRSGPSCTSVQAHPMRENNNFFLSSFPSLLCHHWNMYGILAGDIYYLWSI